MAAWEAAGFGCQLRAVLVTPEMVAFLTATPQAVQVLRPLCRMLAIETSLLRPGMAVVAAPAVAAEEVEPKRDGVLKPMPRERKSGSLEKPDLGRVPIPRGIMAVVRRERLAKGR
jgi:hypothetical protein